MKTALVIGAGEGIGAALVNHLVDTGEFDHVIAAGRAASTHAHPRVSAVRLDALAESTSAMRNRLTAISPSIERAFITIGTLSLGPRPEKSVRELDPATAGGIYAVNAIAPVKAAEVCLPLMRTGYSTLCILSAQVGSIGDNRSGGWYSYRMSKAALNMGIRSLALEEARRPRHATVVAVHPGTTLTGLSAGYVAGRVGVANPSSTARRLNRFAARCDRELHGLFVNWQGDRLPW